MYFFNLLLKVNIFKSFTEWLTLFFFLLIWYEKQMLTTVIKIFLRDLTWAVRENILEKLKS